MVEVLKPGNDYLVLVHDNLAHDNLEIGLNFFLPLCIKSEVSNFDLGSLDSPAISCIYLRCQKLRLFLHSSLEGLSHLPTVAVPCQDWGKGKRTRKKKAPPNLTAGPERSTTKSTFGSRSVRRIARPTGQESCPVGHTGPLSWESIMSCAAAAH